MLIKTADTLAKILLPFALVGGGIVGGWWVGSKTWGFVQNTDPAPFLNFMLTENSFLAAFGDPLYWIIAVIAFIVVFRAIAMKIFNK